MDLQGGPDHQGSQQELPRRHLRRHVAPGAGDHARRSGAERVPDRPRQRAERRRARLVRVQEARLAAGCGRWRSDRRTTGSRPRASWRSSARSGERRCATTDERGPIRAAPPSRYSKTVDGVAVLTAWVVPLDFLHAVAEHGDVAAHVVLGGWAVESDDQLAAPGADLEGVVVASQVPFDAGPRSWREYLDSFERGLSVVAGRVTCATATPSRPSPPRSRTPTGTEHDCRRPVGGDRPDRPVPVDVRQEPTGRDVRAPVEARERGAQDARTTAVVRGVEQTYGGIFGPPKRAPTATSPSCDPDAVPPPWAR